MKASRSAPTELRGKLIARGKELQWHPEHMRSRYEGWINGLNSDWLISRQRYFGVPFPRWYRLSDDAEPDWSDPIMASESELPVDPQVSCPPGFDDRNAVSPVGSLVSPTSWTPGPPRR